MKAICIKTKLESETLILPELRELVGKTVEIRITEADESRLPDLLDYQYLAECEADSSDEIPLTHVRSGLSRIPGELTADFVAERDE